MIKKKKKKNQHMEHVNQDKHAEVGTCSTITQKQMMFRDNNEAQCIKIFYL